MLRILSAMTDKKDDQFNKLLRESMGLVSHFDTQGMPAIQRSIAQLDSYSRKLAARAHPKVDSSTEAQA